MRGGGNAFERFTVVEHCGTEVRQQFISEVQLGRDGGNGKGTEQPKVRSLFLRESNMSYLCVGKTVSKMCCCLTSVVIKDICVLENEELESWVIMDMESFILQHVEREIADRTEVRIADISKVVGAVRGWCHTEVVLLGISLDRQGQMRWCMLAEKLREVFEECRR